MKQSGRSKDSQNSNVNRRIIPQLYYRQEAKYKVTTFIAEMLYLILLCTVPLQLWELVTDDGGEQDDVFKAVIIDR